MGLSEAAGPLSLTRGRAGIRPAGPAGLVTNRGRPGRRIWGGRAGGRRRRSLYCKKTCIAPGDRDLPRLKNQNRSRSDPTHAAA